MEILFPMMSGDPAEPGVLLEWCAADGSAVTAYQVIAEVTVNKFDAEINAPVSGTLTWVVAEGDEAAQGALIATIEESLPPAVV